MLEEEEAAEAAAVEEVVSNVMKSRLFSPLFFREIVGVDR